MEATVSKRSSRKAQLEYLELLPPKLRRIHTVIEEMAGLRVEESVVRGLGHLLDEIKGNAAQVSLSDLADTAGLMSVIVRRRGGVPVKVRALRELLASLRKNYDAALRTATSPENRTKSSGADEQGLGR